MTPLDELKFTIATANSRKGNTGNRWKNKEVTWSQLIAKTEKTTRTAETVAEYAKMKPDRQSEIKDVGGFVGGYLEGGKRKNGHVVYRSLVTLDVDHTKGREDWLENVFEILNDYACIVYSTHKHTPENPRLRLIFPLTKTVSADAYEPLARKIAEQLNIEVFDPTTYQPTRLMYWPSTSKDGEYVFNVYDGPAVDPDAVLAKYYNWADVSEWPLSSLESERILTAKKKQGDPHEKPSYIGQFCRAYSITEALATFLTEEYDATDNPDRYTFKGGSTFAGLVVYEDKYAYSHHGTDPVSGKLVNAFDLVRLHKFGLQDENTDTETPVNKRPSFASMCELVGKDHAVKLLVARERAEAFDLYDDEVSADKPTLTVTPTGEIEEALPQRQLPPESDEWLKELEMGGKGNDVKPTLNNLRLILENDPHIGKAIALDDFSKMPIFIRSVPWRSVTVETQELTDMDLDALEHFIETKYAVSASRFKKAMSLVLLKTKINPVIEFIESRKWDGRARLDTLLIDYLGAEDTSYVRAVTRKTLVAAVKRAKKPGCKFDYVLTLIGEQGLKKSTLIAKLGGRWFNDTFNFSMIHAGNKAFEAIRGSWLVEIPEMSGLAKAEVEAIKAFTASVKDRYRPSWGVLVETFRRSNIFIGTGNKIGFLKDRTGNRRFWPVQLDREKAVKDVGRDLDSEEVRQLWAEALYYYEKGETTYLSEDMEEQAKEIQEKHRDAHPWESIIENYLKKPIPRKGWAKMNSYQRIEFLYGDQDADDDLTAKYEEAELGKRTRVSVIEIWEEALKKRDLIDERSATEIKAILERLKEWELVPGVMRLHTGITTRKGYRLKAYRDLDDFDE